ncbi:unnamed protein product [Aphis gossypii]|uniref:Uncharacterized protein n=1 Tax=Aphis gossypii TaxID=80765 RepID=A0A9P0J3B9_APHGO|nr:unnamed protein product [Aphis gossypii]
MMRVLNRLYKYGCRRIHKKHTQTDLSKNRVNLSIYTVILYSICYFSNLFSTYRDMARNRRFFFHKAQFYFALLISEVKVWRHPFGKNHSQTLRTIYKIFNPVDVCVFTIKYNLRGIVGKFKTSDGY